MERYGLIDDEPEFERQVPPSRSSVGFSLMFGSTPAPLWPLQAALPRRADQSLSQGGPKRILTARSTDGKVMTLSAKGTDAKGPYDNVAVYDKQ